MATLRPRLCRRVQARTRHTCRFHLERLELRLALDGSLLEVPLLPEIDQFGSQIETVMGYKLPGETDAQARIAYGIYDTGASVITFSHTDQALFSDPLIGTPIPIKVPGGAGADAIGGGLQGDVSLPGEIIADGMHVYSLSFDPEDIFGIDQGIVFDANTPRVPGVQAFVGTDEGSGALPTITGTVIHNPSPSHPNGTGAWIDMTAYKLDLGALFPDLGFDGIVFEMPDLRFVEPNTKLTAPTDGTVSEVIRIPLTMWGENNQANPGDSISYAANPVQPNTSFSLDGVTVSDKTMLFDTGAQLSVISTEIALQLGLNLDAPSTTITVQGAAGQETIPGYTIDTLEVPRDDNGDGIIDGVLRFKDVPIYVLDVVPGLDGILGMNLFNLAHGMLFDPFDSAGPSLQVAFFTDLIREIPDDIDLSVLDLLQEALPALQNSGVGSRLPSFGLDVPVNHAPTGISLSRFEVFANTPGSWVGGIETSDQDMGDSHTYQVSDDRFEVRGGNLYLKSGATLDRATTPGVSLLIVSTDEGGLSVSREFAITTVDRPSSWQAAHQWGELPTDINYDGEVNLLDIAQLLSELNATGPRDSLPVLPVGTAPGPFVDVDGDGAFNLTDIAMVLTYINAQGQGEAAEAASVERSTSAGPAITPPTTSGFFVESSVATDLVLSEPAEPTWVEAAPLVATAVGFNNPLAASVDWLGPLSGSTSRTRTVRRDLVDEVFDHWLGDDFAC